MGKRTIWREVGERECGRERGGGGQEGRQDSLQQASGSASASGSAQILVSELRWLLLRPPMRLGLNGSWVFSGFFLPFVLKTCKVTEDVRRCARTYDE